MGESEQTSETQSSAHAERLTAAVPLANALRWVEEDNGLGIISGNGTSALWNALTREQKLQFILQQTDATFWYIPECLAVIATYRVEPAYWGKIVAIWTQQLFQPRRLLEEAVDNARAVIAAAFPPLAHRASTGNPPLAPPLPQRASLKLTLADGAAPWLERYIGHSALWSPRAAVGFHTAVGLWMLSTIAARRICVDLGAAIYPTLFIAMVARSTLYAKTTTAKIGIDGLRQAGCGYLLAADRSTPQALLRSMSGYVPDDYGSFPAQKQDLIQRRNAFAAQRGWYFEEWGGLLHQMTRRDSPMAEFHGLLRVLDDGYDSFESETIQRGIDHVDKPYLALLASATPHDLARFLSPGAPWWHDGFWPRIALIVPLPDELPSMRRRLVGYARLPIELVQPLQQWHRQLGIPEVTIEPASNASGKLTGGWHAKRSTLPCQALGLDAAVKDAYDGYNESLLQLIISGDAPTDLEACYGRLHDKALRIAMLLTSFAQKTTISVPYWAYAQHVVESWRLMLHQAITLAGEGQPLTRDEILEQKLESQLARYGAMTAREIQRHVKGFSSLEMNRIMSALVQSGRVIEESTGRTRLYALPLAEHATVMTEESTDDVPF